MNMKRILVLVMTFAMLMSTFAPTLGVFAEELNNNEHNHASNEKHYVSIGDSMANGYGFEGYLQGEDGHDFYNGVGTYGEGAYLLQFEEYLKAQGYDVTHTKLAVSALRAEDLLYLLGGRDEPADDWFEQVMLYATGDSDNAKDPAAVEKLAQHYQNAVKDADVITLGIGNASFGAFMLSRVTATVGIMGAAPSVNPEYTLENALELLEDEEAKQTVLGVYNKVYNALTSYVSNSTVEKYNVKAVCDVIAYTVAGFVLNYTKSIDKIVELNEKDNLEIVLVGLMNTMYGLTVKVDEDTVIPLGDLMDEAFGLLNAYVAAYPAAKQTAGELEGVTFYYAENTNPNFIVHSLDDLAAADWENVDNGRLSADIVRARTIRTFNGTLRPMLSAAFASGVNAVIPDMAKAGVLNGYRANNALVTAYPEIKDMSDDELLTWLQNHNQYDGYLQTLEDTVDALTIKDLYSFLPEITLADVEAYNGGAWTNEAFFNNDADKKTLSVAVYLAVEDAIVKSVDVNEIPLNGILQIAGDLSALFTEFTPDTTAPDKVRNTLGEFLSSDELLPLVKIYALMQIGDGMCVHSTPTGHDDTHKAIVEAYENGWTAQKETIKNAYEYVVEYYDEAYEFGYAYADENGYTNKVVSIIDRVINRLGRVDLSDNTMTDEFREDLQKELDAMVPTLNELKAAINNDTAKDVPGLITVIRGLKDDVLTHVKNIYALCEQAGIDVNQLIIIPALQELLEIIETELIPALLEMLEVVVEKAMEYVDEKLAELYAYVSEIYGVAEELVRELIHKVLVIYGGIEDALEIAGEIYKTVVEYLIKAGKAVEDALAFANDIYEVIVGFIIENTDTIEEALRIAGFAFDIIVEALTFVYDNYDEIYAVASKVYLEILRTIDRIYGLVDSAYELYDYVVEILVDVFGSVENALTVAEKIFNRLVKLVEQFNGEIEFLANEAYKLYEEILAIIVEVYGETQDAVYTAKMVHKHLVMTAYALNAAIEQKIYEASNGAYELKDESAYVALGNSEYGEELAALLNLSEKFTQLAVDEDYSNAVAGADLVTIKVNNGEFYEFVYTQAMGTLAEIVRSNSDLMGWCENPWVGDKVRAEIESYGIDLDAQAIELEWSKYLIDEDIEALNALLARAKAELLALGLPEAVELDVSGDIEAILLAEGLLLPGVEVALEPIVINVADLAVYALENLLYSYAQFVERTAVLLNNIRELSPDATVVITHVANPLTALPFDVSTLVPEIDQYMQALDYAVDTLNVYLYALAFVNENTIFVDSEDAQDIYDALHVYCDHVYDDPCLDPDCNRCGQIRETGHSFTNYIKNNDATCTEDGTATAKCDRCDATHTVTLEGTATGHNWKAATCTTPKTCTKCGETSGKALGHKFDNTCDTECNVCGYERVIAHKFGDWEVTKNPTLFADGEQQRVCRVCGYTETMPYAPESDVDIVAVVALALGSIIVAFGASTAIILLIQKKREK